MICNTAPVIKPVNIENISSRGKYVKNAVFPNTIAVAQPCPALCAAAHKIDTPTYDKNFLINNVNHNIAYAKNAPDNENHNAGIFPKSNDIIITLIIATIKLSSFP